MSAGFVQPAIQRMKKHDDFKVTTPTPWYVALAIQQSEKQVFNYDGRFLVAKHIVALTPDELDVALWFLHIQNSLVWHFQEERRLGSIVIQYTGVHFDNITEFIVEMFALDQMSKKNW